MIVQKFNNNSNYLTCHHSPFGETMSGCFRAHSLAEFSPSGDGGRIFVVGTKLPVGKRKFILTKPKKYGGEIYSGAETGRYLTVTGDKIEGSGSTIPQLTEWELELVYVLVSQILEEKFKKLWMNDQEFIATTYGGDQSRADAALCAMLVPLFGKDPQKIEAALRTLMADDDDETSVETATEVAATPNNLSVRRQVSVEVEERDPPGFVPGVIRIPDVIACLTAAGFTADSSVDNPVPFLTAALGETLLDERTEDFLWAEIAYDFINKSKRISPLVAHLMTALFNFFYQRNFKFHRNPACFEHAGHRLDFQKWSNTMNVQNYVEGCSQFLEQFFTAKSAYSKFDSAENRTAIVERMAAYQLPPSATAVRRACLELEEEGTIERADGGDEESDRIEAAQAAEERDRRTAFAQPLGPADARLYSSLSIVEITERCKRDRLFAFRYAEACKLFCCRYPQGLDNSPAPEEVDTREPVTVQQYRSMSANAVAYKYQRDRWFKNQVDILISEGKI